MRLSPEKLARLSYTPDGRAAKLGGEPCGAGHDAAPDRREDRSVANGGPAPRPTQYKSKLEERFAGHLESLKIRGIIADWKHEAVNLRLANGLHYRPDFIVFGALNHRGEVAFYETKGYWRDGAKEKLKMAAQTYPHWKFSAALWDKAAKCFRFEDFTAREGL